MGNRKQNSTGLKDVSGLVPPYSQELEEAVLGGCLLEQDGFNEVADVLSEDVFYLTPNKHIYKAMEELYKTNKPIDLLTVVAKLKDYDKLAEIGGAYYVAQLTSRVASTANIKYHARILVEQYLKRAIILISQQSINSAYQTSIDVFDLYSKSVNNIENTLTGVLKYDVSTIGQIHQKNINESLEVVLKGIKSGIPTGFRNLDNFTNGWQKSDLIILAGRPGMGKSVCGLAFALNPALKENIPTAIFSLEMSKEQVVGRAQSNMSGINSSRIIKKQLTMEEISVIQGSCAPLDSAPIYIDDTPSLSVMEFKSKARKLVRDKGVKLLVIDYLQLMVTDDARGNREQEISRISQSLKGVAKELNVPVIALSQLSRAVEARGGDKKPMLSDLRESGSIEQDADMVIFTYRPEYYGIQDYELGGENLNTEGLMCLIVAKHRAGSLGELRFGFNGELTKLENYDVFMNSKYNPQPTYSAPKPTASLEQNNKFLDEKSKEVEPF